MIVVFIIIFLGKISTCLDIQIVEFGSNINIEERSSIEIMANYEVEFYKSIFSFDSLEIDIRLYNDFKEYKDYQASISSARSDNGFYSNSRKEIVVYKNERFLKTIFHELNHAILRSIYNPVPKWINEGISEYFEFGSLENSTLVIYPQARKVERIKEFIKTERIDLIDFLGWSNERWKEENFNPEYYSSSLSWGLIYFLMHDNSEFLLELIQESYFGFQPIDIIDQEWDGGFEQFQLDFIDFYINL